MQKIEVLSETVLAGWAVPRGYQEDNWGNEVSSVGE
jgi:hypothetical protein